jgi:hypothetical protein
MIEDEVALPAHAEAGAGRFLADDAPVVGLGADHHDVIVVPNVAVHPPRPALRRRGEVLVDNRVHAIPAQVVRELQHAPGVRSRIVAVADEHPRRALFRQRFPLLAAHNVA